jgi:hypothetical protein
LHAARKRSGSDLTLLEWADENSVRPSRQHGMGLKLAVGTRGAASAWRIIQTEVVANGCVTVTLKSLSAFGIPAAAFQFAR